MSHVLGEKYDIETETISKPRAESMTNAHFGRGLPKAPAIMVGEELVVQGSDIAQDQLEAAICRHLGLAEPAPAPVRKGLIDRFLIR